MRTFHHLILLSVAAILPASLVRADEQRIILEAGIPGSSTLTGYEGKIDVESIGYYGFHSLRADASDPSGSTVDNTTAAVTILLKMDPRAYPHLFLLVMNAAAIPANRFVVKGLQVATDGTVKKVYQVSFEGRYDGIAHEGTTGDHSYISITIRPTRISGLTFHPLLPGGQETSTPFSWVENPPPAP